MEMLELIINNKKTNKNKIKNAEQVSTDRNVSVGAIDIGNSVVKKLDYDL